VLRRRGDLRGTYLGRALRAVGARTSGIRSARASVAAELPSSSTTSGIRRAVPCFATLSATEGAFSLKIADRSAETATATTTKNTRIPNSWTLANHA
jgi:hypothetical protein